MSHGTNNAITKIDTDPLWLRDSRFLECLSQTIDDKINNDPSLFTSQSKAFSKLSPEELATLQSCMSLDQTISGDQDDHANVISGAGSAARG
jgi:hypothetical protein